MKRIGFAALLSTAFVLASCDSGSSEATLSLDTEEAVSLDISYEYDDLNRLTVVRYANGDVMRYSYDEAGNILSVEMDKAN